MGLYIRRPHIGPIGYRSSRKGGSKSYAGRFILGVILLGATFGVSPVLGWLVLVLAAVIVVALLYRYLRPARPARAKPAQAAEDTAKPEGPRDWTPAS